jgi:hypothetical protein
VGAKDKFVSMHLFFFFHPPGYSVAAQARVKQEHEKKKFGLTKIWSSVVGALQ